MTESATAVANAKAPVIVEVANPTAEELLALATELQDAYPAQVTVKPVEFKFKKSVDRDTGVETIRKPVMLAVPYPSVDGLIDIIQKAGKGLDLLLETMEVVVNDAVRSLLYDDFKLSATNFDATKVSWDVIANLPKAQRKGGGIPKETWESFLLNYAEVMPAAAGKTLEQVANMIKILSARLVTVKTNKPVLNAVVEQLTIYLNATPAAEDFAECVEFLLNKADQLLNVTEEELLSAL